MKIIAMLVAVGIAAPAAAQASYPPIASSPRSEWVMLLTGFANGGVSLVPQRFASEADCKALAAKIKPHLGQCYSARIIVPGTVDPGK